MRNYGGKKICILHNSNNFNNKYVNLHKKCKCKREK